jgi:heme exporter protein D
LHEAMSEFLAMGGYGFYVWGAYVLTFAMIAVEVVAVRARQRKAARMVLATSATAATKAAR